VILLNFEAKWPKKAFLKVHTLNTDSKVNNQPIFASNVPKEAL